MLNSDERDYIYMIWKDPKTRRNFTVAELSKNGTFKFRYTHDIEKAIEHGFEPLLSFNDINKTYENNIMFPVFSSRLPDRKRRDIDEILKKYELKEFDSYLLLKRSGAKLPIDNLEFIDPILSTNEKVKRIFYVAGSRYYLKNKDIKYIKIGDILTLKAEYENEKDPNAIKILNDKGLHLGYIPRYYSKNIKEAFAINKKVICKIINIENDNINNEFIKVEMTIE